jgi:hypothetical protein
MSPKPYTANPGVGRLRKTQGWFLLSPGEESNTPLFEVNGSVSQALMLEITYEEVRPRVLGRSVDKMVD